MRAHRRALRQVLPVLEPGPWISAGRALDYEHWSDRDRFKELDALIPLDPIKKFGVMPKELRLAA